MREKKLKLCILCLVVLSFIAGVCIARAQDDPLLNDVRYLQQVKNTLLQEQRANDLQITMLQNRQRDITNILKTVDQKIKEVQAAKKAAPAEETAP